MDKWYVKNTAGRVFGPIDLATLKSWVKDGRVEPLAGISNDLTNWMLAPLKPELEMNWVVENNPGQFYGPTHRNVVEDLVKMGTLSRDARFFQDDRGAGTDRLRALEAALAAKDQELSRRDVVYAEAQRQAAKRDLALAAAQRAVAQRDERISEAVAALAQRDGQIDALSKALKAKEGEVNRAADEVARMSAEVERMALEMRRREAEVEDLKRQLAESKEVHQRAWKTEVIEPEVVVDEMPPPIARQAFGFGQRAPQPTQQPGSLADLERRAQEELARMGSAGMQKMFRFKK